MHALTLYQHLDQLLELGWMGWLCCPLLQDCSLREIHFGRETEVSIIASAVRTITAEQSPGVKKVLKQGGVVTLHKPVQGFCSEWSLCRSTSVFTDRRGNLEKRVTFWIHDIIISELFCHIHFQSLLEEGKRKYCSACSGIVTRKSIVASNTVILPKKKKKEKKLRKAVVWLQIF